jgi:hypothetical protein
MSTNTESADKTVDPAVIAFLRGRGGQKAKRTEHDYPLGENAIQNRAREPD